jgi:hypothetical protein
VILTDGQTPWPKAQPACRTVVGLFRRDRASYSEHSEYTPRRPPEWARVVTIAE